MKALVLLSGGIDSTTALAYCVEKYGNENVIGLSCFYGQKHDKELIAAKNVANYYKIRLINLDLMSIFKDSDSSLLKNSDKNIPKGSYAKQKTDDNLSTYVPFRNGLFLSAAASIALSNECEFLYYGIHKDDGAAAYPDCSNEFNEAINQAINLGSGNKLKVVAPFVNMTKAEVVKIGLSLNAPYNLTWSCYEGGDKPCGICATCIDRKKAFLLNNAVDN